MGWKATGEPTVRKQRSKWVVRVDGIELRTDGHAIAMVQADGRTLPIRFTFDEGKIARVEVL